LYCAIKLKTIVPPRLVRRLVAAIVVEEQNVEMQVMIDRYMYM